MASCAKSAHQTGQDVLDQIVSAELLAQVDQSLSFADLRSSPANYIAAARAVWWERDQVAPRKGSDRIEILQLPMVARMPSNNGLNRKGVFNRRSIRRVSSIRQSFGQILHSRWWAEVKGAVTKPLDESEYQYPVLED